MKRGRRRAIYDDEKEARRDEILSAARDLFETAGGHLATVTEVAERAGVAKGTVYLYFRTKEEIYVALYEALVLALLERLRALGAERPKDLRRRVVVTICEFVAARPEFLRLASLLNGVLEHNVSEDFVRGYKSRIGAALVVLATTLSDALFTVPLPDVARLLLRSYALAVGLWQQADLPSIVKAMLSGDGALALFQIDFASELESGLTLLWSERSPRPRGSRGGPR